LYGKDGREPEGQSTGKCSVIPLQSYFKVQDDKAPCFICIEKKGREPSQHYLSALHYYLRVIYTRKYGSKKSKERFIMSEANPNVRAQRNGL